MSFSLITLINSESFGMCTFTKDYERDGVFEIVSTAKASFNQSPFVSDFEARGCHLKLKVKKLVSSTEYQGQESDVFSDGRVCLLSIGDEIEGIIKRPCCDTPGATNSDDPDEQLACLDRRWYVGEFRERDNKAGTLTFYNSHNGFEIGDVRKIKDIENDKKYTQKATNEKDARHCLKVIDKEVKSKCLREIREKILDSLRTYDDIKYCERLANSENKDWEVASCAGKLAAITGKIKLCEIFKTSNEWSRNKCLSLGGVKHKDCKIFKGAVLRDQCFFEVRACQSIKEPTNKSYCWIQSIDYRLKELGEKEYQKICEAMKPENTAASCLNALVTKLIRLNQSYKPLEMVSKSKLSDHFKNWIFQTMSNDFLERPKTEIDKNFCREIFTYSPNTLIKKCK